MKVGKYYVHAIPDNYIEREDKNGKEELCKGYYCMVYEDEELKIQVDDFCLAVGYEIPDDTQESLEKGIYSYFGMEGLDGLYDKAEKERQKAVDETTDMITAEDIVEQVVYSVNAPKCCESEHAENMLGMLGANVVDEDAYHDEDECPKLEMGGM